MHVTEVDAHFVGTADVCQLANFPQSCLNLRLLRQLALKYIENRNISESPKQKLQSLLHFRIESDGSFS